MFMIKQRQMKRIDVRDSSIYVNSGITLCYFTMAVFLYNGLAHVVVAVTVAVPVVWYFAFAPSEVGKAKRPHVDMLPLWFLLAIWMCVGEFEDVVFESGSKIALRDFLWMALLAASFSDGFLSISEQSLVMIRIAWGLFVSSGVALPTTDSLARRLSIVAMSYKVTTCIVLYTAYEIRSAVRTGHRDKRREVTKFNLFQSSYILFCWNSISLLAVIHVVFLVGDILLFDRKSSAESQGRVAPSRSTSSLSSSYPSPPTHNPSVEFSQQSSPQTRSEPTTPTSGLSEFHSYGQSSPSHSQAYPLPSPMGYSGMGPMTPAGPPPTSRPYQPQFRRSYPVNHRGGRFPGSQVVIIGGDQDDDG